MTQRREHKFHRPSEVGSGRVDHGDLGSDDEVYPHADPSAVGEGRAARRRRLDAAAEGGVQGVDRLHRHEQIQGQRLVQDLRRQPGGHPVDGQVLVHPQFAQIRVRFAV